jgi:uncharacterized membrane protein
MLKKGLQMSNLKFWLIIFGICMAIYLIRVGWIIWQASRSPKLKKVRKYLNESQSPLPY